MNGQPISFRGTHGAGVYGYQPGRQTTCAQANNPFGHNPECDCGWALPPFLVDEEDTDDAA